MNNQASQKTDSVLDPLSRISEILFGLIMVLTFTGSLEVADVGREDIKEMLIGALGCNLAWGIIDALMFLMSSITARARIILVEKKLCSAKNAETKRTIISDALPDELTDILEREQLDFISEKVIKKQATNSRLKLIGAEDLIASLRVFILVFGSMLPVLVPFLVISDPYKAIRISNLIALIMLFTLGYKLGSYAGRSPVRWGLIMAVIGAVVVSMTIALGG